MRRIDVHQHLWTEPLLSALAARTERPRVRRHDGGWLLQLEGEPDHLIDPVGNDPLARAAMVERDGLESALIAPSSPIGIEALPPDEAEPLLAAYGAGVRELPPCFAAWGAVGVVDPDPALIDARLDEGFSGVAIPAGAMAEPAGLERLDRRGAPLLVHPGPGPGEVLRTAERQPDWWPALTRYVAQMNDAWHAFLAVGRRDFPSLRVVFVMLAGLAPLHLERLRARGGPTERSVDRNVFYDTSSYGSRSVDAMIRCVGIDQIVYGSDRPVVEPHHARLGEAARHATLVTNPARLLGVDTVEA
jgi:hypothetical protein